MHDFHCKNADDMYYDVLAERVRELKETPKGVEEMCKELEELYADRRAEGIEIGETRGEERGISNSISALMENVKCTLEQAMDMLEIAVDSRDIYRKMLEK